LPEIILYPDATNSDIPLSGDLGGMRFARYILEGFRRIMMFTARPNAPN
jgi:hypothetical protein